jgi:LPXTG-site transpeptidase (sortase) family protein
VRLPAFLEQLPRGAYVLAIPAIAFVVTVAVVLGTSGGGDGNNDSAQPQPTPRLTSANLDVPAVTPTSVPRAEPPAPSLPPNRANCDQIRGTAYESPEERDWYLANCINIASSGGGGGGSGGGSSSGSGGGAISGPSTVGGGEYALGDRLVIPRAGVNAPMNGVAVPSSGAMPDPVGYFNGVLYDFPNHPGLGGSPGNGNAVIAGHVDSARYGAAIFYNVRNLGAGDTIQYVKANGQVLNYVVTSSYAIPASGPNWNQIASSGAADLTLITCTGTFAAGEYNQRHVVHARLV